LRLRPYDGNRLRLLAPVFYVQLSLQSMLAFVAKAIVGMWLNVDSGPNRLYSFEAPRHLMA